MSRRRIFTGFINHNVTPVIDYTDVLIIAGQSNARGTTGGVTPLPPFVLPNQNAFIAGLNNKNNEVTSFNQLDFNEGNALGITHGAELGFAYNYGLTKTNKNVYIVKVSEGNTSLTEDWAQGRKLRNKLIEYINLAKNEVPNPRFSFYWNQWEADSREVTDSNNYESNYQDFITDVLNQTGVTFYNHIIQKANQNSSYSTDNPSNYQTILTAQINNSNLYGAYLLDSDSLPLFDTVHYGSLELHQIGQDISNLIIE